MTYDDRDVVAGTRYGYRLAWTEPAGDQHSGETWLDIPALALAIAGFSRNPSSGSPSVSMTLASDAPATLEVLDVTGRRLARHDLGGLGAGRHSVPIATRAPLAAGVYVLRLTQAGRTVTAKGVVFQ
jgi:hypothetical protein